MLELDELVISIHYEYELILSINMRNKIFSVFILILFLILNNGI